MACSRQPDRSPLKRTSTEAWAKVFVGLPIGLALWCGTPGLEAQTAPASPFSHRIRVPPLPDGLTWLNTAGPLQLDSLRGKFVLLDFWTYCCINCMHILPELEKLERAYPNTLVVIGVHSAKFATEQDSRNITEAILRYRIRHPVVNDPEHRLWNRFGIQAWPTLLLIDPEGYAVWGTSGEATYEAIDRILKPAMTFYGKKGLLDETPLRFDLAAYAAEPTRLRFPGKVLADEAGGRLFIADSGHHRIVVTRPSGQLMGAIGSGLAGATDGDFATARFQDPQGMALSGQSLYVADTGNHLIRRLDLSARRVTTVAGTGVQNRQRPRLVAADPLKQPLNSPWALAVHEDWLYIAMAGPHQIWRMALNGSTIGPYAGNGREDIVDGPLLPRNAFEPGYASFAQPSGLAAGGQWLYVADSEGSSIRAVPWDPRREVRTVVGTADLPAARLFTFGDVDGPREQVRLQHPLGIAYYRERLYVADTYNNKIKVIDSASGRTTTLAGTGETGRTDNPPRFNEPGGIAAAAGKLYVADTNNHLIRWIDLAGDGQVRTLEIPGLAAPEGLPEVDRGAWLAGAAEERLAQIAVRPIDRRIQLSIRLELPPGHKLNRQAPMAYRVDVSGTGPLAPDRMGKAVSVEHPATELAITLPVADGQGRQTIRVGLQFFYCREGQEGLCKAGSVVWTVPLDISPQAPSRSVELTHRVP